MKIFKTIVYHFLMAFRGLFFTIFNFLTGILGFLIIVAVAFYIFDKDVKLNVLGAALGCSVIFMGIYLLKHFYDKIIFWAKPDDIDLTLYK
ncbi:hypothetical protein [Fusobacterium animalis]|uniref:hypothetical protein n=1 Tax=Fusobacterium animalis TaxID=76859 RepID=UPI001C6F5C68|nr:hypothetical protein [Fusobacterium animalis]QYR63618.1 hypothetical protein JY398_00185 [Fusobacterium animalis]